MAATQHSSDTAASIRSRDGAGRASLAASLKRCRMRCAVTKATAMSSLDVKERVRQALVGYREQQHAGYCVDPNPIHITRK